MIVFLISAFGLLVCVNCQNKPDTSNIVTPEILSNSVSHKDTFVLLDSYTVFTNKKHTINGLIKRKNNIEDCCYLCIDNANTVEIDKFLWHNRCQFGIVYNGDSTNFVKLDKNNYLLTMPLGLGGIAAYIIKDHNNNWTCDGKVYIYSDYLPFKYLPAKKVFITRSERGKNAGCDLHYRFRSNENKFSCKVKNCNQDLSDE